MFSKKEKGYLFPKIMIAKLIVTLQTVYGGGAGLWYKRIRNLYSGMRKPEWKLQFLAQNSIPAEWKDFFTQQLPKARTRNFKIVYPSDFDMDFVAQPDLLDNVDKQGAKDQDQAQEEPEKKPDEKKPEEEKKNDN